MVQNSNSSSPTSIKLSKSETLLTATKKQKSKFQPTKEQNKTALLVDKALSSRNIILAICAVLCLLLSYIKKSKKGNDNNMFYYTQCLSKILLHVLTIKNSLIRYSAFFPPHKVFKTRCVFYYQRYFKCSRATIILDNTTLDVEGLVGRSPVSLIIFPGRMPG